MFVLFFFHSHYSLAYYGPPPFSSPCCRSPAWDELMSQPNLIFSSPPSFSSHPTYLKLNLISDSMIKQGLYSRFRSKDENPGSTSCHGPGFLQPCFCLLGWALRILLTELPNTPAQHCTSYFSNFLLMIMVVTRQASERRLKWLPSIVFTIPILRKIQQKGFPHFIQENGFFSYYGWIGWNFNDHASSFSE